MTPERWARIKILFALASDAPVEQRAALLAREAADDPELIPQVEALLRSHEAPGGFLDGAPVEMRVEALANHGPEAIGERIGAYRVVEMIGTGGMGDVFKAVRDDEQYRAEVAIKLMRADIKNPLAEQRFKTERQILAQLDHRNIARLLDGGTTARGLPYVVMELVTGEPIDRYCDAHSLPARERVRLFLQVCAAVSFAHQHLVVHRDLKPNNILVTADGSVKLLDFGIAKLLEPDPVTGTTTEETVTQFRAMTLEYASPEQVSGGAVTTVSDVYSLGVVLYRLLTGQSPYRSTGGDAARVAEILGDTTPTRPSQVSTRERREVDGDLDHILLMALRKEPRKRFDSVEQLANDLRNYLAGRPVLARRGTLGYRLGKFVRRNRIPLAAGVLVAASLVGGLAFTIREARIAEGERQISQRHFASVRKLSNKLFDFHDAIAELPGATKAREMLVTTSLEYLDALYKETGTDPGLQEELGVAYRKVGDIQGAPYGGSTGDPKAALVSYAKSIELLEPLYAGASKDARVGSVLAKSYLQQANTLLFTEGAQAALSATRKAVATAEASAPANADEFERMKLLGNVYWEEAMVTGTLGDTDSGMAAVDKMVLVAENYAAQHPEDVRGLAVLETVYSNASVASDPRKTAQQTFDRNLGFSRRAMAASEKLLALEPEVAKHRWNLADTRLNLAMEFERLERYAEALELLRLAVPVINERASDRNNANAQIVSLIASSEMTWSRYKSGQGDDVEPAMRADEKALATMAGKFNLQVIHVLANQRIRMGEFYVTRGRKGDWRLAREVLVPGIAGLRQIKEAMPEVGDTDRLIANGEASLAKAKAALELE